MFNRLDDAEAEKMEKKRFNVGFIWNFISASHMINRIDQEVGEPDGDYPKTELLKIWGASMVIIQIFLCLMYNVITVAVLPFIVLYAMNIFKVAKVLKRFNYKEKWYWPVTILLWIVMFLIGILVRFLLFGD